jgi:hypothetical protein
MPFILTCYVNNYLDRVSMGYGKRQFMSEMHMNEAAFGMVTSVFFFGYIASKVPSYLLLLRIGEPGDADPNASLCDSEDIVRSTTIYGLSGGTRTGRLSSHMNALEQSALGCPRLIPG